jgi:hypothetical protein
MVTSLRCWQKFLSTSCARACAAQRPASISMRSILEKHLQSGWRPSVRNCPCSSSSMEAACPAAASCMHAGRTLSLQLNKVCGITHHDFKPGAALSSDCGADAPVSAKHPAVAVRTRHQSRASGALIPALAASAMPIAAATAGTAATWEHEQNQHRAVRHITFIRMGQAGATGGVARIRKKEQTSFCGCSVFSTRSASCTGGAVAATYRPPIAAESRHAQRGCHLGTALCHEAPRPCTRCHGIAAIPLYSCI